MVHYTDFFLKDFEEFLAKNVKAKEYNFKAYLEELNIQHGANGTEGLNSYELSKFESKSGNPELFLYNAKYIKRNDDCFDIEFWASLYNLNDNKDNKHKEEYIKRFKKSI